MSAYKAIFLKKQQKSKYNLCKHQFRGNLKIKNQSISPKRLLGIEFNVSYHVLLNFLDYKPLSELLKTFSCITVKRKWRVVIDRFNFWHVCEFHKGGFISKPLENLIYLNHSRPRNLTKIWILYWTGKLFECKKEWIYSV